MVQIGFKELTGHLFAVRHDSFSFIFGMISLNMNLPVGKIDIANPKGYQFLTA